jgi:hypothetical protein
MPGDQKLGRRSVASLLALLDETYAPRTGSPTAPIQCRR